MAKRIALVFVLFLAIPFSTYAITDEELQAQIASVLMRISALEQRLAEARGGTTLGDTDHQEVCSILYGRSLSRGMSGTDVSILQRFLKQQYFFDAEPTGYFGPITESALIESQLTVGIISYASQGGVFGPRTREYINNRWCSGDSATQQPPAQPPPVQQQPAQQPPLSCPNPSQPTLSCAGGNWVKTFNQYQCHVGWTCVVMQATAPEVNKAPLISAIVGHTVLKLNEVGTWKITASDPDGDALVYSVVWGDEGVNVSQLLDIAQQGAASFSSATSIMHSYANTGAYTMVVFAKDTSGNVVKALLSIVVYEPMPQPPPPPPTPAPAPSTNASCLLLGRKFPHGTTLPFGLLGDYIQVQGQAISANAMQLCVAGCGGGYRVRYQCQNGDWVKIDTGYDYWPYPMALKPVIYLYPTTTQEVTVKLRFNGKLAYTYPPYNTALEGWKVIANPDGTLTNLADNREYSYLFWEGKEYPIKVDENFGFVVKGSETREFLQTKLAALGLTPREYNEFIVFWLPRMEDNAYNFVQFVGDEYTKGAPLTISPSPDSTLRVFMAFKPLTQFKNVTEQKIQPFERKGFTVIEWGGTEL